MDLDLLLQLAVFRFLLAGGYRVIALGPFLIFVVSPVGFPDLIPEMIKKKGS